MKTKQLLFAIVALIMFKANAQPPTAAPTPTQSQADVISVFSGAYTNVAGTDFNPNWGQGTLVSDYIVPGDTTKSMKTLIIKVPILGQIKLTPLLCQPCILICGRQIQTHSSFT